MYAPYGFTALTGQNAASTQAKNMHPTMPGYAGLDSMTFEQMRTPEDQIHWLYLYASNLQLDTINAEQAQALVDASAEALKAYVDAQDGAISADVQQKYDYLLSLIVKLSEFPGVVFDPTEGFSNSLKDVVTNVYDFDRVFSVTAGDYDTDALSAAAYDAKGTTARVFDIAYALANYAHQDGNGNGVSYEFVQLIAEKLSAPLSGVEAVAGTEYGNVGMRNDGTLAVTSLHGITEAALDAALRAKLGAAPSEQQPTVVTTFKRLAPHALPTWANGSLRNSTWHVNNTTEYSLTAGTAFVTGLSLTPNKTYSVLIMQHDGTTSENTLSVNSTGKSLSFTATQTIKGGSFVVFILEEYL